jgi:hypothetical protein
MPDASPGATSEAEAPYLGDMTTVARKTTPTEANLLKNMLIAAGIPAVVADANLIQADSWMVNAYGGVRIMVRAAHAEAALETIKAFESGSFELDIDEEEPREAAPQRTDLRLWGADAAAFWSLFLTPVFGSAIHYLNSRTLGHRQMAAMLWMLVSLAVTVLAFHFTFSKRWDPAASFQASLIVSGFTFIWYVFSGRSQSAHIVRSFGSQYVKRPLFPLWMTSFVAMFLIGLAGEVLA